MKIPSDLPSDEAVYEHRQRQMEDAPEIIVVLMSRCQAGRHSRCQEHIQTKDLKYLTCRCWCHRVGPEELGETKEVAI